MLVTVHPENPQKKTIATAVEALGSGKLVGYPTDTSYGIGCDLRQKKAIDQLYRLKRKDHKKTYSIICNNFKCISHFAYLSDPAYRLMRRCLPGPFTFILNATNIVPKILLTKRRTIGVRMPKDPTCAAILDALGSAILSTTASDESDEPIADPHRIEELFGHQIAMVIDNGLQLFHQSTVIDLTGETPEIIREGDGYLKILR